ncbi:ABC transporter substrate-binding protein [Candidatus Fokinia crypta]|uniref:Amino acid ABC transporter substrate-binding protein n=1 Tax=Candidatus Fokinia crypta TaxID=1920990 RepID=A0ABZ0UQ36_9RICK|nr:ABC transporter substrate-binding protein [Candidatus Fokinia cryptica]WPX97667.1 Putative amino acid ABC transporter substrate-binding protein [Candidatus Fokinia cryptica]
MKYFTGIAKCFLCCILTFKSVFAVEVAELRIGTEGMYPPFEFYKDGELTGFDVDLGNLVAQQLGVKPVFVDMTFNSLFPAVNIGKIDVAIATISASEAKKKNFAFSDPYYEDTIGMLYINDKITKKEDLSGKIIGIQFGTTGNTAWINQNCKEPKIVYMDNNNMLVEALKAKRLDVVIVDVPQAKYFAKNNKLKWKLLGSISDGYRIVMKKDSKLLPKVNDALKTLTNNGEIGKLKKKWGL